MAFHPGSGRTRHEIVGRVTAGGGGVAKFKVGDIVGVGCLVDSCRTRPKGRTGLEPSCDNGLVMSDGRTETRRGGRSDRAARRGRSSGRGGRGAERQPPATVRLAVRNRQPGRLRAGGGGPSSRAARPRWRRTVSRRRGRVSTACGVIETAAMDGRRCASAMAYAERTGRGTEPWFRRNPGTPPDVSAVLKRRRKRAARISRRTSVIARRWDFEIRTSRSAQLLK